jgi:hypothetical protein
VDNRLRDTGNEVNTAKQDTDEVSHTHRGRTPDMTYPRMRLGRSALALRGAHIAIAIIELASLGYLWVCASTGRRDRALAGAVVVLSIEGASLVATRGDCPLAPLQERLGDPVPLFELALRPRTAKLAVPVLAALATMGVGVLIARGPRVPGSLRG